MPHKIGIFVRSAAEIERARAAAEKAGIPFRILDEKPGATGGYASISTMHLAKGLEFRAVAVMACDDEVIPLQERIEAIAGDVNLSAGADRESRRQSSESSVIGKEVVSWALLRSKARVMLWPHRIL